MVATLFKVLGLLKFRDAGNPACSSAAALANAASAPALSDGGHDVSDRSGEEAPPPSPTPPAPPAPCARTRAVPRSRCPFLPSNFDGGGLILRASRMSRAR